MESALPGVVGGLPWTAWVLLAASIGLGLALEILFYLRERRIPEKG